MLNLDDLNNEELEKQLYSEILYYDEDLFVLAKLLRKELPKKYIYRIISKMYRLRHMQ